jgi:hypothetical protein
MSASVAMRPRPLDQVFLSALDHEAGRGVLVGGAQGLGDLVDGHAVGRQPLGIQGHLELLGVAADRQHLGHARPPRARAA